MGGGGRNRERGSEREAGREPVFNNEVSLVCALIGVL